MNCLGPNRYLRGGISEVDLQQLFWCPIRELKLEKVTTLHRFVEQKENLSNSSWLKKFTAKLMIEGSEALQVLHGAGFVHGDLSPRNVGFWIASKYLISINHAVLKRRQASAEVWTITFSARR